MLCSFIENQDINFYKNIFEIFYCKAPISTFDNILVFFKKEHFDHAFYESLNRFDKLKGFIN